MPVTIFLLMARVRSACTGQTVGVQAGSKCPQVTRVTVRDRPLVSSHQPLVTAPPDNTTPGEASKRLEDLLKMDRFLALPDRWEHSDPALAWHSKVSRLFNELKTCDVW